LLAVLVILLIPVTVTSDPCPDCGTAQGCCSSSGCPCCLAAASIL